MITLVLSNWQLHYLHWVFSHYANAIEDFDVHYKLYSQYACRYITRLLMLKAKNKKFVVNEHETDAFIELVSAYHISLLSDKNKVIERRLLQELTEKVKKV